MTTERKPRTASAIFQKGFLEPYLRAREKPFIKLLNWYTGFGKTYTAAVFAIDLFINCDVIPVFIAPLQSLVAGFSNDLQTHNQSREYADHIEDAIRARGASVPVHRMYSVEYHLNDRTFFGAVLLLLAWLERTPRVVGLMDGAGKHARTNQGFEARLSELRSKCNVCQASQFLSMPPSDDAFEDTRDAYQKAARRAHTIASSVISRLIVLDVSARRQGNPDERWMAVPEVADMVRRLHPLQAFLDDPGIIVSTASKAEVAQKVYAFSEAKNTCVWHEFENLPLFLAELNRDGSALGRMVSRRPDAARVVTFVDEEEDSYWYLFEQRKSVVNPGGRNDLNVVVTEFFTYFDLKWSLAFERGAGSDVAMAGKVYRHLEVFAEAAWPVHREFEAEKLAKGAQFIPDARRVAILRDIIPEKVASQFTDEELALVLNQLHDRNDVQNQFKRFRQKARVLAQFREYVKKVKRLSDHTDYETFRSLRDLVFDKKFFTMSRSTYGEVLDQPGQTFFNESASVMDTEFLKHVELQRDTAHQTVRLCYHEHEVPAGAYTLLDYLELVLFMAKVLVRTSGGDAIDFSRADGDRYPNLRNFRTDVGRLFKDDISSEGLATETSSDELLTDAFFFNKTKSVVTLEESRRQAEEYNLPADVSLTLTITTLRATPEEDIVNALGRTNGVYLMSATGGLAGASAGAFNVRQLRRVLEGKGGLFSEMSDEETDIVSAAAAELLSMRTRHVTILDDSDPASRFAVSPSYKGLLHQFKEAIPKRDEPGYALLNRHKHHEIEGLVASLDRLLSSGMRSGLVLCQTITKVQKCLMRLASDQRGWVQQKDTTGHHFVIKGKMLPTYRSAGSGEDITVILYNAPRFRKKDRSKISAEHESDDAGQFSPELEEALDITHKKILLWTAYASASRGINFVTKRQGKEQDFELFCLLNDPYYTRHTRPGSRGFSMEMFQSFAQVIRDENEDWPVMSRGDLLYQYARNRWKRLRKEHVIDITRTVFQALGRGERRPHVAMPEQSILLSSEAARTVHLGLRHAEELRRRASPAQRSVLLALEQHNTETALFATPEERQASATDSLKKSSAFRSFTGELPSRFRSDASVRLMWTELFKPTMFRDPVKYLQTLTNAGVPAEFRDGCFLPVPVTAEPYTRDISIGNMNATVITDAFDGAQTYDWVGALVPDGLVSQLSSSTRSLLLRGSDGFVVNGAEGKVKLLPQPWFVTEIMKGYIAELEFEEYVKDQFGISPLQLSVGDGSLQYLHVDTHELHAELYQLFDYYLLPNDDTLVAVDMKNWARSTDRLNKVELQHRAEEKHATLRALLPDKVVHAVYVNLHGAHKHSVKHPPNGSIRFMSLFVPGTGGAEAWITNQNLAAVLMGV